MYINKQKNGMTVLFGIIYLLFFLLSAVNLTGRDGIANIKPDILLSLACVCPVFCTKKASAVYALLFGFLTDISVTPPAHLSPLVFLLAAYLMPKLSSGFSRTSVAVCAVCSCPVLLIRAVTGLVYLLRSYAGSKITELVKFTLAPELAVNFAAVIVTYFICVGLVRLFRIQVDNNFNIF